MNIVRITFTSGQTSLVEIAGINDVVAIIANCIQAGNSWEVFCPSGIANTAWIKHAEALNAVRAANKCSHT